MLFTLRWKERFIHNSKLCRGIQGNSPKTVNTIFHHELICNAGLEKAPKTTNTTGLVNLHRLIVWGSPRCVSLLIRYMHWGHFPPTNVVQALVECMNAPFYYEVSLTCCLSQMLNGNPHGITCACLFVRLTSFSSCLILHNNVKTEACHGQLFKEGTCDMNCDLRKSWSLKIGNTCKEKNKWEDQRLKSCQVKSLRVLQ